MEPGTRATRVWIPLVEHVSCRPSARAREGSVAKLPSIRERVSIQSRRKAMLGCVLLRIATHAKDACASSAFDVERGMSKLIRRKERDPLDSYVVPLLLCVEQMELLSEYVKKDHEALVQGRNQLREGPFTTLRDDLRALAEYGMVHGRKDTEELVKDALKGVDRADSMMLRHIRSHPDGGASPEVVQAILDGRNKVVMVLETVPPDVRKASEQVLEVLQGDAKDASIQEGSVSEDYAELEKIL